MPRFAANLSMLYPELPFLDRFEAAARDGFVAVEFMFPYEHAPAEVAARARAHGLQVVLINTPPGGMSAADAAPAWAAGERGTASRPGREAEFRAGFSTALGYAQALGCPRIHAMPGLVSEAERAAQPPGATSGPWARTPGAALDTYIANLRWAAEQAAPLGVAVLIEPINTRDIPGFFLNRQADAHAVVEAIGCANLQVQMDLYHCQIVEGDLATRLRTYLPTGRVGHIQIAGVPQRHEPDVGEVAYPYLFDLIDELSAAHGWQGWVGCEYRPARGAVADGTSAGLGWLPRR